MSKRVIITALTLLILIYGLTLMPKEALLSKSKCLLDTVPSNYAAGEAAPVGIIEEPVSQSTNTYGRITNKVAVITDTLYTSHLIPLILHYHTVLGPDWPIIFYTSPEFIIEHLQPKSQNVSASWRRAVEDARIQVRVIPDEFDLTSRDGVNLYLSRPWFWEELAPAQNVLIFQADSVLCANAHRTVDDFLEWDFVGASLRGSEHLYNGGLSLRNRTMILDILGEGNNWEKETKGGEWDRGGEDVWFSWKMGLRGAHLPEENVALQFACQHERDIDLEKEPLGYHKVHKDASGKMDEIAQWCPEIRLAEPGRLRNADAKRRRE